MPTKRTRLHFCHIGETETVHIRLPRSPKTLCGREVSRDVPVTVGNWTKVLHLAHFGCYACREAAWRLYRRAK